MLTRTLVLISLGTVAVAAVDNQTEALWSNDFEAIEVGGEPEGVLVQDGTFTVQQDGENKVLELAGEPLGTMGVSFGPSRSHGVAISARIQGKKKGRSDPSFGVGLGGVQGYRLMVSPMRDAIEITRGEEIVLSVKYKWESGSWTFVKLAVVKASDGKWTVQGKAWPRGRDEPKEWAIELEVTEEPPSGKGSLWGMPYSGLAIRYDDVMYEGVK